MALALKMLRTPDFRGSLAYQPKIIIKQTVHEIEISMAYAYITTSALDPRYCTELTGHRTAAQ